MKRPGSVFIPVVLFLILTCLTGCTTTFFGTVMVFTFRDIVSYVSLALFFGVVAAFLGREPRTNFWFCFLLSIVLTPLAGLIYCLILLTKKSG